ncbi:hypothetical protein TNCV_4833831 [Trichonephila clavipes]|nr:hypothetical protein TNCV_4833831 [Trichonephila clavipes]
MILSMDELNLDKTPQDINKEEFELESVRLFNKIENLRLCVAQQFSNQILIDDDVYYDAILSLHLHSYKELRLAR